MNKLGQRLKIGEGIINFIPLNWMLPGVTTSCTYFKSDCLQINCSNILVFPNHKIFKNNQYYHITSLTIVLLSQEMAAFII